MIIPEEKQYKLAAMLIYTANKMNGMVFVKWVPLKTVDAFLVLTLYYQQAR